MNNKKVSAYLQKKAEKWVSLFVLAGCITITASLCFVAIQADALGDRLGGSSETVENLN